MARDSSQPSPLVATILCSAWARERPKLRARSGFRNVKSADGDADALASLLARQLPRQNRLLHAGNEESRGDLTGRLRARVMPPPSSSIFRAVARIEPGPVLAGHLTGKPAFEAILIHSPRGASILAGFAAGSDATLNIVAISGAAATPLAMLARRTEIAAAPNEQALLSALSRLVSG